MTSEAREPAPARPELTVARRVVAEMIALAALEVPGISRVARGGPRVVAWLAGPPVRVRIRDGQVEARIHLIARPGQALPDVTREVRSAAGGAIVRLLGLGVGRVTVVVDGVGA